MIIQALYFLLLILFVFYLPGRYILRLSKYTKQDTILSTALSLGAGIASFLLGTYILAWLGVSPLYNLWIIFAALLELRNTFVSFDVACIRKFFRFELVIIILGSLSMLYIVGRSGVVTENGMVFYGVNARDGIYHMAFIGNMLDHFPPTHPELGGLPLRGYHFFYDFLLAKFIAFYHVEDFHAFFRFFPFFIAFFYGLSGLALAGCLKMQRFTGIIFIYLLYFAGGIEYLLPVIFQKKEIIYDTGLNNLLINILNPSVLLSLSLLFLGYILMFGQKRNIYLPVLLFGVIPQIKIYTALLLYAALLGVSSIALIKNKTTYFFSIFILSVLVGAVGYLPFNFGQGGLIFSPLLVYRHFFEMFSSTNSLPLQQRLMMYSHAKNYLMIFIMYAGMFGLFFIPSLGIRLMSLLTVWELTQKKFYTLPHIFWMIICAAALVVMTFFIQNVDVFNIIQFLWFAYIILLLPTAFGISHLANMLPLPRHAKQSTIFILVVMLTIPATIKTLQVYSGKPYIVSHEVLKIGEHIKETIPESERIFVVNIDQENKKERNFYDVPVVAALSQHDMFYEPTITTFKDVEQTIAVRRTQILAINVLLERCAVDDKNSKAVAALLQKLRTRYILTLEPYHCLEKSRDFTLVQQYGRVSLFTLQ